MTFVLKLIRTSEKCLTNILSMFLDDIGKDIPEFKNYLEYLFEIKKSRNVATRDVVFTLKSCLQSYFIPRVQKTGQ